MAAFYNEIDPYAAQWLRNLIAAGHVADGVVDERDIRDIAPEDLNGFVQCHFFAGIGVWSHALRLAGWSDDRPVWTGSCPCQPFSVAGLGGGFNDERHLWPFFHHLIEQCRPPVVFGEQVASKDGLAWLDLVLSDMEGSGYAATAVDLCAAGVGAPHIRQRLWFVADTNHARLEGRGQPERGRAAECVVGSGGVASGLADAAGEGWRPQRQNRDAADSNQTLRTGQTELGRRCPTGGTREVNGHWRVADWLLCRDAKWRPVESGTFPLVDGAPSRVGRLRAYGNAIVSEAARAIIEAYMECRP